GTGLINETDFTGADLTEAVFTGATVNGTMTIKGANLTGAALNNPNNHVTIYPNMIVLDSTTNFTRAQLQYIDFSGYTLDTILFSEADMTGCKLHKASLIDTEMAYATLDGVDLTGTVWMNGANLSNASLKGADLTSAQLGALSKRFAVASDAPNYAAFLQGLQTSNTDAVVKAFGANGYTLSGTVTITASHFSTTTWTVEATLPT